VASPGPSARQQKRTGATDLFSAKFLLGANKRTPAGCSVTVPACVAGARSSMQQALTEAIASVRGVPLPSRRRGNLLELPPRRLAGGSPRVRPPCRCSVTPGPEGLNEGAAGVHGFLGPAGLFGPWYRWPRNRTHLEVLGRTTLRRQRIPLASDSSGSVRLFGRLRHSLGGASSFRRRAYYGVDPITFRERAQAPGHLGLRPRILPRLAVPHPPPESGEGDEVLGTMSWPPAASTDAPPPRQQQPPTTGAGCAVPPRRLGRPHP